MAEIKKNANRVRGKLKVGDKFLFLSRFCEHTRVLERDIM